MTSGEIAGYIASLLVFTTFYMKTMVPLRLIGIASNLAFIIYASLEGLVPVLVLHALLLPLNILRLRQIMALAGEVRASSSGDPSLEALLPLMSLRHFKAGEVLFRKGERSAEMFYIRRGIVRLLEIDKRLSDGAVLGEISMFAPDRARTVSAICETDTELLMLGEADVLRMYYQHPKFAFYLARLITHRLIENQASSGLQGAGRGADQPAASLSPAVASTPATGPRSARFGRDRQRLYLLAWAVTILLLLIYGGWALAPYARSVLFRDAAITTWINVATSPIHGSIQGALPTPGERVGEDGRLATVRNLQADPSELERAQAQGARSEAHVTELQSHLDTLRAIEREWHTRTWKYATTFKQNLDTEIDGARRELAWIDERLTLKRGLAERARRLAQRGNSAQSTVDQALADVKELERQRAQRAAELVRAVERRQAAEDGVYLLADGRDPGWAHQSHDRLRLEISEAARALAEAQAEAIEARADVEAARQAFALMSTSPIEAPPGSLVWSTTAGAGAAVEAGTPVAKWIDCRLMLVDVPAHDTVVGLLAPGRPADVLIEGRSELRQGRVLLTRGAASTLGEADLAATAKGRSAGTGQVLVELERAPEDVERCAIGIAAWVDFPDLGLFDLLRARLRL